MAPKPLLPNLGKASANGYWMDLTVRIAPSSASGRMLDLLLTAFGLITLQMNVMFNSQERTLREIVALALSAGWKVIKLTQPPGSLFGYIVAVPIFSDPIAPRSRTHSDLGLDKSPRQHRRANAVSNAQWTSGWDDTGNSDGMDDEIVVRRALSRCGTPTFGSKPEPPSVADALLKFGGGVRRVRGPGAIGRGLDGRRRSISTTSSTPSFSPSPSTSSSSLLASPLKPAASIVIAKQRSAFDIRSSFNNDAPSGSTLASQGVPGTHHAATSDIRPTRSPSPINLQIANGPRLPPPPAPPRSLRRPSSLANMRSRTTSLQQSDAPFIPPLPTLSSLHCSSVSGAAFCSTNAEKLMEGAAAVPQRVMSPAPPYGRTLRGRSSLNQLISSSTSVQHVPGACHVPFISPPAYSQTPTTPSFIPVRSHLLSGSSIPRAPPAFTTSSSTRSMQVGVSQQIGMGQNGASVCVNLAPQRKPPALKEVGRRASSVQLGTSYSTYATKGATTQVRFSENHANDAIGRSPTPLVSPPKKLLGSSIPIRSGEKRRSGGSGVANFMRGAGQKLGGMLRFERQDGNEAAKEKIEKLERKLDAYLTDSERTRGRGGQTNGRGLALP